MASKLRDLDEEFKELCKFFKQLEESYKNKNDVKLKPSSKERIIMLLKKFEGRGSDKVLEEFENVPVEEEDGDSDDDESSASIKFNFSVVFNSFKNFELLVALQNSSKSVAISRNIPAEVLPRPSHSSSSQSNNSAASAHPNSGSSTNGNK